MAITTLDLSHAALGPEHCEALSVLLKCVFPLRAVSLANNPLLGKKALVELADALSRRKSLKRLDLSRCGVSDKALAQLHQTLVQLKHNFVALDVSFGALTAAAGATLGAFAQENPELQELRLSGNKLGDKGVAALVQRLGEPKQHEALQTLTLAGAQRCTATAFAGCDSRRRHSQIAVSKRSAPTWRSGSTRTPKCGATARCHFCPSSTCQTTRSTPTLRAGPAS